MKKIIYKFTEFVEALKKEIDIYMTIRKWAHCKGKRMERRSDLKRSIPVIISIIAVVLTVNLCYAQAHSGSRLIAPEPGGILLVLTGTIGWIIRFTRKRFLEFKKAFDIIASVIALIIISPIVVLAAIFIKLVSPGPVFFKQQRVGLGGKVFNIYKLRTMKVDAEKDTGAIWARDNDPRLIKFGKIIRKTHIDELPQFYNVLIGDMSIVGPRPERPELVGKLKGVICDYEKRLRVKPGITGLAQVRHKYDETIQDVKKKIKYDLLYIREMCLMVDLRILARTFIVVLTGKGAK